MLTNVAVALGAAVELADALDVEAVAKFAPEFRPQTIAEHEPYAMLPVGRLLGLREQVARDLAYVLRSL